MDIYSNEYFEMVACPVCAERRDRPYFEICYGELKQKPNLDYRVLGIDQKTRLYVKRCENCGLVFVNPRLKASYEYLVYNECKKGMYQSAAVADDKMKKIEARREKIDYLSPLLQAFVYTNIKQPNLKLFDFGCGFGYSMGLARELGIDTYGIDIDLERLAFCEQKGLKVAHPDEFDIKYKAIKADIILWMSNIEHLIDLQAAASYIRGKCKQGSILYVNGLTPRTIRIERRRGEFVKAHFIEHINYFPLRTLDRFMSQHGFRPLTKPYMTVIKAYKDIFKGLMAFAAGKILGYNPVNGAFARLYRYVDQKPSPKSSYGLRSYG